MLALRVTVSFTLVCEKEMKDNRKKKRDSRFFIVNTFLALIAVKILLCRGSAQKIATDSRNSFKIFLKIEKSGEQITTLSKIIFLCY
jgi:hypothetical protein